MSHLFYVIWLVLVVGVNSEEQEFILNVDDDSEVIGLQGNNAEYFLGIQYATVGERFSKSTENSLVESSSMNGTLLEGKTKIDASSYGPICYQPLMDETKEYSEDCLYLNIWRPQGTRRESSLAVMVWVHGGGFVTGSGSDPLYNGAKLASERYIIVITINYRLGAFGFMVQDETGRGGTNGLDDQLTALKWIQKNIEIFGGDPNRVTLMGSNAGGISVCYLSVCPLSKGLFRRAIIQSGQCISSIGAPDMPSEGHEKTTEFLTEQGMNLEEVLVMPPEELAQKAEFKFNKACVDGGILQTHPLEFYHGRSDIIPEDIIIGSTTYDDPTITVTPPAAYISNSAGFEPHVEEKYGFLGQDYVEQTLDAYKTYFYAGSEVARYMQFSGDAMSRCAGNELAPIIAGERQDGRVYSYVFSEHSSNDISNELITEAEVPEIMTQRWASHTAEIPFLFGNWGFTQMGEAVNPVKDKEIALSKEIMARWSNFAEAGVPRTDYMGTEWTPVPWNLEASLDRASDTPYLELKTGQTEMIYSNLNKVDQCTAIPAMAIFRSYTKVKTNTPTATPTAAPFVITSSPTWIPWTYSPDVGAYNPISSSSAPRSFLHFSSLFGFLLFLLL